MLKKLLLGLVLTSALLVGCSSDDGTDVEQPAGETEAPVEQETNTEDEAQS